MHRQSHTNIPDRDDCKGIVEECTGCGKICTVEFFEIVDDVVTDNVLSSELQCDTWPVPANQFRNGNLCLTAPHLVDTRMDRFVKAHPHPDKVRIGQKKQKAKAKLKAAK